MFSREAALVMVILCIPIFCKHTDCFLLGLMAAKVKIPQNSKRIKLHLGVVSGGDRWHQKVWFACPQQGWETLPGTQAWRRERAVAGGEQEELLEAGFSSPYLTLIPSSQVQVMQVSGEVAMAWLSHAFNVSHRLQFKKAVPGDLYKFRPSTTWHPVAGCITMHKNYCKLFKMTVTTKPMSLRVEIILKE